MSSLVMMQVIKKSPFLFLGALSHIYLGLEIKGDASSAEQAQTDGPKGDSSLLKLFFP
jgi:hypothetical protein